MIISSYLVSHAVTTHFQHSVVSATATSFVIVPETLTNMYNITEAGQPFKGDIRSSQGVVEFNEGDWMYTDTDSQNFGKNTDTIINFTKVCF